MQGALRMSENCSTYWLELECPQESIVNGRGLTSPQSIITLKLPLGRLLEQLYETHNTLMPGACDYSQEVSRLS